MGRLGWWESVMGREGDEGATAALASALKAIFVC